MNLEFKFISNMEFKSYQIYQVNENIKYGILLDSLKNLVTTSGWRAEPYSGLGIW